MSSFVFKTMFLQTYLAQEPIGVKPIADGWSESTCVILENDGIKCVGRNWDGPFCLGDRLTYQMNINDIGNNIRYSSLGDDFIISQIATGPYHSCYLSINGTIKCCGANKEGELGYEDRKARGSSLSTIGNNLHIVNLGSADLGTGFIPIKLAAGLYHSCALSNDNKVKCWGSNNEGQLGLEYSDNIGDNPYEMGDNLSVVHVGDNFILINIKCIIK